MAKTKKKTKRQSKKKYTYALGRRKNAVTTLRLYKGKGKDLINEKDAKELYKSPRELRELYLPFKVTDTEGKYYFSAKTSGGGKAGQLDSIQLAISRALEKVDETLRKPLKVEKLLAVDDREKERKKPGLKKARKKEQYSKR